MNEDISLLAVSGDGKVKTSDRFDYMLDLEV